MNTSPSPAIEAVTYAELAKFLGPEGAGLLSRTVWKDGIDIEVPIDGIQQLVDFKVSALLAAKQEEVDKMREALEKIRKGAPTECPERYEGDNHGDTAMAASDIEHFRLAEIARTALSAKGAAT